MERITHFLQPRMQCCQDMIAVFISATSAWRFHFVPTLMADSGAGSIMPDLREDGNEHERLGRVELLKVS